MKGGFAIFFTVVLSIYVLVNSYIYLRGRQALSLEGPYLWVYRTIFFFLVLSFPAGRIIRAYCECALERFLVNVGSWWGGAMFYLFLLILVIDLVRLIFFTAGYCPEFLRFNTDAKRIFASIVALLTLGILVYGYFNASYLRVKKVALDAANPLSTLNIKAAMISDVHLGILIGQERLSIIVERINSLNPDIVFIVGDLVDENVEAISETVNVLKKLSPRLGSFAVTGNHEFYAGAEKAVKFMEDAGIRVLRDEFVTVDGRFNIAGIDDPTALRFGYDRKTTAEILKEIKNGLPVIFLSHQPRYFKEAARYGANLMLAGHVHGGQMFPNRYLTNRIYGIKSRIFKEGDLKVIVSDGVGTWGPPIRVGTSSEIVEINMGLD